LAARGARPGCQEVPVDRPVEFWLSRDTPLIVRYINGFLSGMRELGYVEGRDFDMAYGMADFHADRMPQVTAELVKLGPDVILAGATLEAVAAAKATATIPIIVGVLADPVALGFATSDARPTGNVTGIMPYVKGLPSKQLELARELVPGATGIGLVDTVTDPKAHPQRQEIEATGRSLEIEIVPAEVRTAADIDAAYQTVVLAGVQAVVVEQSNVLILGRQLIAQAAASKRLPTVYGYRQHGLLSPALNLRRFFCGECSGPDRALHYLG
jgi:putative tryptophan/tyrosine transport system substrate-binding protein